MLKRVAIATLILAFAGSTQAEIIYVSGPSFPIPAMSGSQSVDINNDGAPDFIFRSEGALATFDVPSSGSSASFYFDATGTNQFLVSDYAFAQSFGSLISSNAPAASVWSKPGATAALAVHWQRRNRQGESEGWNGSLGKLGVGYLGVRFHTTDGLQYGWIRVRLPNPASDPIALALSPNVVDWAYETKANVPIRAGAIGSNSGSVQFAVDFRKHGAVAGNQSNVATFILTGGTLRGELSLAGKFHSADLRGAAPANVKQIASFGQPLIGKPDFTVFFREVTLSPWQIIELKRDAQEVTVDAKVLGKIRQAK